MSANVEGTGFNGENDEVDETSEFYQWMMQHKAKPSLIKKLIINGYDSIDMIEAIGDDLDEVVKEAQLKVKEKINLKMIIKNLSKQHAVVDTEETKAMIQMENKLKSMITSVKLVTNTKQNIDEQVANHTKTIKNTFKEFHSELNKREANLIKKLNDIANDKKHKLTDIEKKLNEQTNASQQKIDLCHKSLKKAIEITQIEERKKGIIKIAKDINNVKIVTKDDSVISGNKIDIKLDKTTLIKAINSFGNVFSGCMPILISLKDNKDCTISVKWKLSGNQKQKNGNNKLKIEWTDIESKNDGNEHEHNNYDNEMKLNWKYTQEFNIKSVNDTKIDVKVQNKTVTYLFRIKYFNGETWSNNSNIKSIKSIKSIESIDKWDKNAIGTGLTIKGNAVEHTAQYGYRSAYLTNVVSTGVHTWTFRADNITDNDWNHVGIWKTNSGTPITNIYFTNKANNGYAYAPSQGWKTKPSAPGSGSSEYGGKCKSGDVIQMTIDFNTLSLSYKVNGSDKGKAFDIERTTYRAAISYVDKGNKFTLMNYKKV